MREITIEELESYDFYLIGDTDRKLFFSAIIGIAKDKSCVAYSYDKLITCYVQANDWSVDEAIDWIEYNVIRALPYYGSKAPTILEQNFISERNKKYEPIKIKSA